QYVREIASELGISCIFLRYNPNAHNSDENILLERIQYYLDLKNKSDIVNIVSHYGIKIEYLFYDKDDELNNVEPNNANIESVIFTDIDKNTNNDSKNIVEGKVECNIKGNIKDNIKDNDKNDTTAKKVVTKNT